MDLNRGPEPPTEATLLVPPNILQRMDFVSMFGSARPVEIELGSGDGSFLIHYAAAHPERNFLGVERLLGRLRKIERKGLRLNLQNVRGLRLEAAYVVEWMIPEASVDAIHVYFPDPWPKRRHWRRRLVNHAFAAVAWKALRPGGVLYLRTDHSGYFQQMLEVLGDCTSFQKVDEPVDLLGVTTDFERGFNARGIPTLHAAYQRPCDGRAWENPPQLILKTVDPDTDEAMSEEGDLEDQGDAVEPGEESGNSQPSPEATQDGTARNRSTSEPTSSVKTVR